MTPVDFPLTHARSQEAVLRQAQAVLEQRIAQLAGAAHPGGESPSTSSRRSR